MTPQPRPSRSAAIDPSARRTKIVATLGPASRPEQVLAALIAAGVDVFRLNFSYGTAPEHRSTVAAVRALASAAGRQVAILADLQGPKIRIGRLDGGPFSLAAGDRVDLLPGDEGGRTARVYAAPVGYPALVSEVRAGSPVLLGDGELQLVAESVSPGAVECRVVQPGPLRERQGIHAPGLGRSAPSLTPKDRDDAALAVSLAVGCVALSFVRRAGDVRELRLLLDAGAPGSVPPAIVAKIEKPEALEDLGPILDAADGVMVARGDLGLEMPLEKVPLAQKEIIRAANAARRLVITATQMLESMVTNPRPTRAEVSDVANAILDGTDAVMLSGETAAGAYPVAAASTMAKIAAEVDASPHAREVAHRELYRTPAAATSIEAAMARAAAGLARDAGAAAIAAFTRGGYSAQLVSSERPAAPIYAFTDSEVTARRLASWWGVIPLVVAWPDSTRAMVALAERRLRAEEAVTDGQSIVMVRWSTPGSRGWTDFVHLHRV